MSEIAEIAAKARNLSRNTHDGIAIEEYLLRHLPALSSAAAAEREPVAFVSAMAIRHHIDSGTSQTGTVLHREQGELYGEKHLALYLDPPPTSELEAENARLRAERDEANARAESQWAGWIKEECARKAAEARLAEAMKAFAAIIDRSNNDPLGTSKVNDMRRIAEVAARRVREGGKVDG